MTDDHNVTLSMIPKTLCITQICTALNSREPDLTPWLYKLTWLYIGGNGESFSVPGLRFIKNLEKGRLLGIINHNKLQYVLENWGLGLIGLKSILGSKLFTQFCISRKYHMTLLYDFFFIFKKAIRWTIKHFLKTFLRRM